MNKRLSVVFVSILLLVAFTLPSPVLEASAGRAVVRAGGQAAGPDQAPTGLEEEHLATVFGDEYRAYCARTPRYLGLPRR